MQRQALFGIGILATLGMALFAAEAQPSKETPALENSLMRAKLVSTQSVVEGLVEKDFRMINAAAVELLKTCESDDWESNTDSLYADYREQLRRQSKKLIDQAGMRNLEGATYAYMGVLSTCVDCHSHCRDVLMIATEKPRLRVVPIPTTAVDSNGAVIR
jgi:hypothetical protein